MEAAVAKVLGPVYAKMMLDMADAQDGLEQRTLFPGDFCCWPMAAGLARKAGAPGQLILVYHVIIDTRH